MNLEIGIRSLHFETPLGNTMDALWGSYKVAVPAFSFNEDLGVLTSSIPLSNQEILNKLSLKTGSVTFADRSTLLALLALENMDRDSLKYSDTIMLSVGSSRGASELLEQSIEYLRIHGRVQSYSSPMTTLGNIASNMAQRLGISGIEVEHSMTCSTALQSFLNGMAWLRSGMADLVIAGAVEAPLTAHTIAQMKALKIYSTSKTNVDYPLRALDLNKKTNGLILGEAAVIAILEKYNDQSILKLKSFGFATEPQKHPVSIDPQGKGFQKSMQMALKNAGNINIDVIICHATGTIEGDKAEINAIEAVFKNAPLITSTKWMTGHSFGSAGMHSILMAHLMFEKQQFITAPYLSKEFIIPAAINTIMINTLGFGGQAISLILSK